MKHETRGPIITKAHKDRARFEDVLITIALVLCTALAAAVVVLALVGWQA